ncbi:MAG: phosphoenolpyruvate carboxykinase (GTP), partial [Gammaproteobacteria bacterium]|nr:phosphoenolpyruvate carboxykinase (GTP) [Gammaproteobacteria bacterium]
LPNIYYVNWFRKDDNGKFMWPGFGENSRVLKWVFERCNGTADAIETPIGNLPTLDAMDFSGLDLSEDAIAELLRVEVDGWLAEIPLISDYFDEYADRVPPAFRQELESLKARLEASQQNVA